MPEAAKYSATDETLWEHATAPLMRILIARIAHRSDISYDAARQYVESEGSISRIFTTRMGHVAGYLIERIHEVEPDAPLINTLVVSQKDRMPSKGAGSFMAKRFGKPKLAQDKAKERYPDLWRSTYEKAAAEVYDYGLDQWVSLYQKVFEKKLSKRKIAEINRGQIDGTERDGRQFGGGGEGKHHRALRLWVCANPGKIRAAYRNARTDTEWLLDSADRVDAVFFNGDETVVLEVKSRISNRDDLYRGVFQCVKYRAVAAAMDPRGEDAPITAYLVTEEAPTGEIKDLLRLHNIKHFQAPKERS